MPASNVVQRLLLRKPDCEVRVLAVEPLCVNGTYVDHLLEFDAPVSPLLHLLVTLELKGPTLTDRVFWHLTAEFTGPKSVDFSFWNASLSRRSLILAAQGVSLPGGRLTFHLAWRRVMKALEERKKEFLELAAAEREARSMFRRCVACALTWM